MPKCSGCSSSGSCNCILTVMDTDSLDLTLTGTGAAATPWVLSGIATGGASLDAWTLYTPVWTTSGVAPSLGDGTLRGAYREVGKTLDIRFEFIAGTTTTFGTGEFRFSMPLGITAIVGYGQALAMIGFRRGVEWRAGAALIGDRDADYTTAYDYFVLTSMGANDLWGSTTPSAWANRDRFAVNGTIEIA